MTDTNQPLVLYDLLASTAKLEGNLLDAMEVRGEHGAEVEPILEKVRGMFSAIETRLIGLPDEKGSSDPDL